ncbi:MFS transporter [Candidatus Gottesmanbacteria bacterium]|nr:MFS transporter [Candidatus Gottesmanbacteria bacterium]
MISSYLAVVKNPKFRNLWLGQISSQIALNMLIFVLAIRVYQQTHSNTAVSLMLLAFGIPSIMFGILAGGLVDFFDKRLVLIFCNIFRVLIFLALFFLQSNLLAIYALIIIISIVTQLFVPAEAPSIPILVEPSDILTANSLFTVSFYLSTITGFILSGPMLNIFGFRNVYLIMTFIMLLATYFVYLVPPIKPKKRNLDIHMNLNFIGKTVEDGLLFIKSNERITQSLILVTFSQALISTLAVLAPGFADKVLRIALTEASYLVMGPAAVGLIIGAVWIGGFGIKFLKGSIILSGISISAVVLLLLSLATRLSQGNNFLAVIILLFLLGVSNSFISVPANTILQEDSKSDMRGRVYGVLTSLTGGVSLLPVLFSGLLADVIGVGKTLAIIGFVVLIIGAYHYLQRRRANNIIKLSNQQILKSTNSQIKNI